MSLLSILMSLIGFITPLLSAKQLLKLSNNMLDDLLKISLFIFIVEITRNITRLFLRKISQIYMIRTVSEIKIKMLEELIRIETTELNKNSSGVFIDRFKNDTNDIVTIFSDLVSYFADIISDVGIFASVAIVSPIMFIFFMISSIISALIDKKRRDVFFNQSKELRKRNEKITGLISEFVRGIRDLKLLDGKNGIMIKAKKEINAVNNESLEIEKSRRNFDFFYSTYRDINELVFIILGIFLIYTNNLVTETFLILYMYKDRIEALLNHFNAYIEMIKRYNLSATRVFELLGNHFEKESLSGKQIEEVKGNIEFKNVSFSYDDENKVLNNINFKIKKGERIGFVGLSGSGKSTIFNLITKLYRIKEGTILVDNKDINQLSYSSLRSNISHIPQSPYIFNFSILDNLKISNPNASLEEVIDACKKANIYDRIMEFENGFDAIVGEGGTILSGGEKQRLAIARALLKNTNIILFDEATSALDNVTQDNVQNAIYGLDKDKTILIIAHRLSTVVHCDKIVLIDDGKIVDIGTHQNLLERCPKYQELFKYEEVENY